MPFDQLSDLESQSGTRGYTDDPDFQQLLQNLRNKVLSLQQDISKLRSDVNLLGHPKRDTARVRERVTRNLEKSQAACKDIGEDVKRLQSWEDLTKQQAYEQNKVSTEFQALLRELQELTRVALDKQKASVNAARAAQDAAPGQSGEDGTGNEQLQQQELMSLAPQSEVDFQADLIAQREQEIQSIDQGVSDLNVLFRQVAQIVSEQGEQLFTIADNIENVRDDTRGAMIETAQAAKYQKAARNKSCCLLLVLAVILTIILLAIFVD